MFVTELELRDFRVYGELRHTFGSGTTVLVGENGQGKTTVLEAVAWAATGASFRRVTDAALVREGADQAILRMGVREADGREQLLEAEINAVGRNRVLLNHRVLTRDRDRASFVRVTVFAPDDLDLVKGAPVRRREYLDGLLASSAPRYGAARTDFDRVLRQRNALLRAGRRERPDPATLSVFDEQLVAAGRELVRGRLLLTGRLIPHLTSGYRALAGPDHEVAGRYEAEWHDGTLTGDPDEIDAALRAALVRRREQEWARGVTLVGPHRDDWALVVNGLDARTRASQGEQRSLALALRLGGHALVTALVGEPPVLLLDDVFSELDGYRTDALVASLPAGQTIITTATDVPDAIDVEQRIVLRDGGRQPA